MSAEAVLRQARHAEACGLDSVWLFDHLLTPVTLTSRYPYDVTYPLRAEEPILDPLGILGVLAGATARIQLGTEVFVAPYRHPIVLGKALATIERFAPGRLVCGLGSGWMQEEFEALGVPFAAAGRAWTSTSPRFARSGRAPPPGSTATSTAGSPRASTRHRPSRCRSSSADTRRAPGRARSASATAGRRS